MQPDILLFVERLVVAVESISRDMKSLPIVLKNINRNFPRMTTSKRRTKMKNLSISLRNRRQAGRVTLDYPSGSSLDDHRINTGNTHCSERENGRFVSNTEKEPQDEISLSIEDTEPVNRTEVRNVLHISGGVAHEITSVNENPPNLVNMEENGTGPGFHYQEQRSGLDGAVDLRDTAYGGAADGEYHEVNDENEVSGCIVKTERFDGDPVIQSEDLLSEIRNTEPHDEILSDTVVVANHAPTVYEHVSTTGVNTANKKKDLGIEECWLRDLQNYPCTSQFLNEPCTTQFSEELSKETFERGQAVQDQFRPINYSDTICKKEQHEGNYACSVRVSDSNERFVMREGLLNPHYSPPCHVKQKPQVEEHDNSMSPTCQHTQRKDFHCHEVSQHDARDFYKMFHLKTKREQDSSILKYSSSEWPHRRSSREPILAKRASRKFFIPIRKNGKCIKVQICKQAFCEITGLNRNHIQRVHSEHFRGILPA